MAFQHTCHAILGRSVTQQHFKATFAVLCYSSLRKKKKSQEPGAKVPYILRNKTEAKVQKFASALPTVPVQFLQFRRCIKIHAGRGSRVVWRMNSFWSLGGRDCGFESSPGHWCLMCVRVFLCLCCPVFRSDHPSKESYRLWIIKKLSNEPCAPTWERAHE
jgi:hypothetical protein